MEAARAEAREARDASAAAGREREREAARLRDALHAAQQAAREAEQVGWGRLPGHRRHRL